MKQPENIKFSGRAIYKIIIKGKLDQDRSDQLAGLTITNEQKNHGVVTSTLVGEITDQAALSGILNILYNLRFSVLSVTCLGTSDRNKEQKINPPTQDH